MPDSRIGLGVGLSFIIFGGLVFSGLFGKDATETVWIVIGGSLFGLGIAVISLVARNWLHWRRELRDQQMFE